METTRQGTTLYTAVLVLVATVVIVQLWMVAAGMEALLAKDMAILLPLAIGSCVLFMVNAGLLWFIFSFDRRLRSASR